MNPFLHVSSKNNDRLGREKRIFDHRDTRIDLVRTELNFKLFKIFLFVDRY